MSAVKEILSNTNAACTNQPEQSSPLLKSKMDQSPLKPSSENVPADNAEASVKSESFFVEDEQEELEPGQPAQSASKQEAWLEAQLALQLPSEKASLAHISESLVMATDPLIQPTTNDIKNQTHHPRPASLNLDMAPKSQASDRPAKQETQLPKALQPNSTTIQKLNSMKQVNLKSLILNENVKRMVSEAKDYITK